MELDDFKNTWHQMGNQTKETQHINLKLFDKMGKQKMYAILKKIILPEILGSTICIFSAIYIGINFHKLDKLPYQISGVLTILLFIVLSGISLMSIWQLYQPADAGKSYADALKEFAIKKIRFCKLQKLNITLSYLLFVTVILLLPKLFGTNHITGSKYFFIYTYTFGYSLLLVFSKWVFKSYNKTIRQTEDFLKELAA